MKKFLFIIGFCAAVMTGCKPTQGVVGDVNTYGVSAVGAKTYGPDTLDVAQIDSLVRTDRLPALKKWTKSVFVDEETGFTCEYRTLYDKTSNIVYTVKYIPQNTYILSKRKLSVR